MAQKSFPCGETPLLTIRAETNLSIQGSAISEVQATIEDLNDLTFTENKNGRTGLIIICDDDCALVVPENSQVAVDEVGGNVSVSALKGVLYLSRIEGNVSLNNIGDAAIKSVDGNCRIDSAGSVSIEALDGNLKGSELAGPLTAIGVDGNIKIESIGTVEKLVADGNIEIGIREINKDMEIAADGNIYVILPNNAGFTLEAVVGGNLTSRSGDQIRKMSGVVRDVQFGAGGPRVKMIADGNITISDKGFVDRQPKQEEGKDFVMGVNWGKFNERIQKRIEARTLKAERRAMAIQRKAMKRVRDAMKSVEGFDYEGVINESLRSAGWPFAAAGTAGAAEEVGPEPMVEESAEEREAVTDAERMLILNMLHDKQITAEEAERLLDALEGKFHNQ